MEKSTSQILQEARALIKAGWCQQRLSHHWLDGRIEYCLIGALAASTAKNCLAVQALHTQLPEKGQAYGPDTHYNRAIDLINFNNAPERTQAEVIALFDRALTEVTK